MSQSKKKVVDKGIYPGELVWYETKTTKAGNGKYLNCTFELKGENEGHRVYDIFLLEHPNDEALEIHQEKLEDFKEACGYKRDDKVKMRDLKNKRVELGVKVVTDDYGTKNKIAFFKVPKKEESPN